MELTEILKNLRNPENCYKPVAFWFLNHYPEAEELIRQIREMSNKGFGGIMLHARDGLRGGYLDTHWERTVRCCLEEATKLGLEVYFYDELNYPSGPAGGKIFDVCPDTALRSLCLTSECRIEPGDCTPAGDWERFLILDKGWVREVSPEWRNSGCEAVTGLGFKVHESKEYPDYLCKADMEEFVKLSYHWYAERFKEYLGNTVRGEFTDNSCANFGFVRRSIPWTVDMPELFRQETGRELNEVLPSLFLKIGKYQRNRIIFWRFINQLYLKTFIIPIEQECRRNGIAATGHYCIEEGSSEHVRQLGDRFDQKRHQHIPGVDMLGKNTFEALDELIHNNAMPLAIPMTASPAYLMHNSRVLCECFGLAADWGMTLGEMRRIGGLLAVLGVDLFVPHGIYYSIAGHRKRECVPDFYHHPLWEFFDRWAIWTGRICALSAHSEHLVETALLYPVTSQQASLELDANGSHSDLGAICDEIDSSNRAAAEALLTSGIGYEIIDEAILNSAQIKDGELRIATAGGFTMRIRTLILPAVWIVNSETYDKLREFVRVGGLVISLNRPLTACFDGSEVIEKVPFLELSSAEEFLPLVQNNLRRSGIALKNSAGRIVVREWIKDGRRYAMLHNVSRRKLEHVEINCRFDSPLAVIDLERVECFRTDCSEIDGTYRLFHDFEYGETLLLTPGEAPARKQAAFAADTMTISGPWRFTLESPNALRLNSLECRNDHQHRIWRTEFEVADLPEKLGIALDLEPNEQELRKSIHPFSGFEHCRGGKSVKISRVKCLVNGQSVENIEFGTHFDRWIYEGEITPLIKLGKNVVEIHQPSSLLDSNYVPDPVMITGNFGLRNQVIIALPEYLEALRWDQSPLAEYSGAIRFGNEIILPEQWISQPLELELEEAHEVVQLFIQGIDCGVRIMPPGRFLIPSDLTAGKSLKMELRVLNTPFNRWREPYISGIIGNMILKKYCKIHYPVLK